MELTNSTGGDLPRMHVRFLRVPTLEDLGIVLLTKSNRGLKLAELAEVKRRYIGRYIGRYIPLRPTVCANSICNFLTGRVAPIIWGVPGRAMGGICVKSLYICR